MNFLSSDQEHTDATILIIEDEPTERMLTRVHLSKAGYTVIEAEDGPTGLELAHKVRPDLVILDLHLPTTSGFDICRSFRASPSLKQVPILISTGLDDTDSVAEGFNAGATDFLTKPIIWGLLSYRVKFLLRSTRVEQELANVNRLAQANAIALAENERHYRDLFEYTPVMMHRIDDQFLIRHVNKSWLSKTGYLPDDVVGHDFSEFMAYPPKAQFEQYWRREFVNTGNVVDRPCQIQCKDGTLLDALLTSTGEYDDNRNFLGAHTVLLDVTERIRAERKMREAQETAEAASRAKSVFLATMSHEIRTPLNGVIGMIDLLEHTELNSDQASMIMTVRDSAYSLLRIIGDILDFSKIEAGELIIEQIDTSVTTVVEGVIDTLVPLAREKNIDLDVFTNPRIPDLVSGDPVRMRQILFNLVGNAVKFSERKDGKAAKVTVEADLPDSKTTSKPVIRFTVSDTGMGISQKHLARLFTPFFQAEDSTVRRFGGTGLGLSICRNLVDLMGGEIFAESEIGKGSTFTVDLPLIAAKTATAGAGERLRNLRILPVALESGTALIVRNYLAYEAVEIDEIGSLKDAKQALAEAADAGTPYNIAVFSHTQPQSVDSENQLIATLGTDPGCTDTRFVLLSEDRRNRTRAILPACTIMPKQPISRTSLMQAMLDAAGRPNIDVTQKCAPQKATAFRRNGEPVGGLILLAEDNTINQQVIQRQLRQFGYIADVAADGVEAYAAYQRGNYKLLLTDCHMPEMDGFELTQAI